MQNREQQPETVQPYEQIHSIDDLTRAVEHAEDQAEQEHTRMFRELSMLDRKLDEVSREFSQDPHSLRNAIGELRASLNAMRGHMDQRDVPIPLQNRMRKTQERIEHAEIYAVTNAEKAKRDIVRVLDLPEHEGVQFAVEYDANERLPDGSVSKLLYGRFKHSNGMSEANVGTSTAKQNAGDGEDFDTYFNPNGSNGDGIVYMIDTPGESKACFNFDSAAQVQSMITEENQYQGEAFTIFAVTSLTKEQFQDWLHNAPKDRPVSQWRGRNV